MASMSSWSCSGRCVGWSCRRASSALQLSGHGRGGWALLPVVQGDHWKVRQQMCVVALQHSVWWCMHSGCGLCRLMSHN